MNVWFNLTINNYVMDYICNFIWLHLKYTIGTRVFKKAVTSYSGDGKNCVGYIFTLAIQPKVEPILAVDITVQCISQIIYSDYYEIKCKNNTAIFLNVILKWMLLIKSLKEKRNYIFV